MCKYHKYLLLTQKSEVLEKSVIWILSLCVMGLEIGIWLAVYYLATFSE